MKTVAKRFPRREWLLLMLAGAGIFTGSCARSGRIKPVKVSQFSRPVRVACVGDSITFGFGLTSREQNCYPARLAALLGAAWNVRNFGVNSATLLKQGGLPYWKQQAYRDALRFEPDVVIIMLGTNDTRREDWEIHQAEFVADYLDLIHSFKELKTRPRIYLCRPVPLFRDRGKAWDTDRILREEILPRIDRVAARSKLPVLDFYQEFSAEAGRVPDGVHPDAAGAAKLARSIAAVLTGAGSRR